MNFAAAKPASTNMARIATTANNLLTKPEGLRAAASRQRAARGIFGRNTASNPIAGRNAHTW